MNEFTWIPDFGAQGETSPRVSNVKFGDGYEQRFSLGLNTMPTNYNLVFQNRDQNDRDDIVAFLREAAGTEAFEWAPPGEEASIYDPPRVFVCRKWTVVQNNASYFTINASFEEVYES